MQVSEYVEISIRIKIIRLTDEIAGPFINLIPRYIQAEAGQILQAGDNI
jgi:hypothetical protein